MDGLLLRLGHKDAAEADIHQAILLAQKTNARARELRAALDLAQILKDRGDVATACGLLAPLCAKFTEGYDTADLKERPSITQQVAVARNKDNPL